MLRQGWRALRGTCTLGRTSRAMCRSYSAAAEETVEVCFMDPALVLEPARLSDYKESAGASSIQPYVCLRLPAKLVPELGRGRFQVGDMDDPQSHWFFGREGEVFQYKYRGSHVVQSGYSSAVPAEVLRGVERGESVAGEGVLLFKGRVVDCESAGVYTIGGGGDGDFEGVMLSSEYESAD